MTLEQPVISFGPSAFSTRRLSPLPASAAYEGRMHQAVWLATRSMLTGLSSAKAICAQPVLGSIVSMLKSSRLRLEVGSTQKIPRLQMSPTCIGVVVTCVLVKAARAGLRERFTDCPATRFQLQAGG